MSEPLEHVLRALPPWRAGARTECGRDAAEFASVLTRDQFVAKVHAQGKQRSAMSTCMTCWHTGVNHTDWEHSPSGVIARDAQSYYRDRGENPLDGELRAVAALIDAHRDEFDAYLAGLGETASLTERRAERRARQAGDRPTPPPIGHR